MGLILFSLGGLLAGFSQSMEMLVSARIIQGLGAAAIVSIVRVIINDIYNRLEGASAFALMSMIMSIVPIISFVFGGLICDLIGWRGTMFLIFVSGLLLLTIVFVAPNSSAIEVLNLLGSIEISLPAPIKFALIKWNSPIGPVPNIATVSPLLKGSHSEDHCLALSKQPVTDRGSINVPN